MCVFLCILQVNSYFWLNVDSFYLKKKAETTFFNVYNHHPTKQWTSKKANNSTKKKSNTLMDTFECIYHFKGDLLHSFAPNYECRFNKKTNKKPQKIWETAVITLGKNYNEKHLHLFSTAQVTTEFENYTMFSWSLFQTQDLPDILKHTGCLLQKQGEYQKLK